MTVKTKFEVIRDEALSLEGSNIERAFSLMEEADRRSPNDLFVKNKLLKYQKMLDILRGGSAIMEVRPSGIGDMLTQVSRFYWFCEYYNVKPLFYIPEGKGRNELPMSEVFDLLGFNQADILVDFCHGLKGRSLSEPVISAKNKSSLNASFFVFDSNCYGNKNLKNIVDDVNPHGMPHCDFVSVLTAGKLDQKVI